MKKITSFLLASSIVFGLVMPVSAASVSADQPVAADTILTAMRIITGLLAVIFLSIIISKLSASRKRKARVRTGVLVLSFFALALSLGMTLFAGNILTADSDADLPVFVPVETTPITQPVILETDPLPTETEVPTEPPRVFAPAMTDSSNPENFGIEWEIMVDDKIVDSYTRPEPISFGKDCDYFALPGIATFRGNNHRNNATYGTATVTAKKLTKVWSHGIGRLGEWGGCAWTGQPLLVQWDEQTRSIMKMYDSKKAKEDLVEVIYATLDGKIHFYDLEDGKETRKPISVGMNFKGAGALDPRGYPLLYVGSGVHTNNNWPVCM